MRFLLKQKEKKEKYRHQNNWLEEADDNFDLEENLYPEEEDYDFEDELDSYFRDDPTDKKEDKEENENAEDDYDY